MYRSLRFPTMLLSLGVCAFLKMACTSPVAQPRSLHDRKLSELLDPSPSKRQQAQHYFKRMRTYALPSLRRALRLPHPRLHLAILPLLQDLGPAALPAAPEIFLLAHQSKGPLRAQAIQTLRTIGPLLLPSLEAIAKDETLPIPQRTLALFVIGSFGTPAWPATPILIQIAREEADLRLRNTAIFAIGRIGPLAQQALPTLLETLKLRHLAGQSIEAIARMGPLVLPTIRVLLHSPSADLRRRGIKIAGKLGVLAYSLRLPLLFRLNDPVKSVRDASTKTLHKIGPKVLPALRIALQDGHWRQRANAAYTLGLFGPAASPALQDLIRATHAAQWQIRRTSAWALGKIGPKAQPAAPALFALLYDPSFQVRQHALRSLPRLQLPPSTLQPPLKRFFQFTQDPEDLLYAARVYSSKLLDDSSFFAWKKLLHITKKEPHVFFALRALQPHPAYALHALPEIIAALDRYGTQRVQHKIAQIFSAIGPLAVPSILSLLRGQHHRIQMRIVQTLGDIPSFSRITLPELLQLARRSPFYITRQALLSLGRLQIPTPSVLALFRQTLQSPDFRYRAVATQAIEHMGEKAAPLLFDLFEATRDIHWKVRQDTVRILGKILPHHTPHATQILERLKQALADEDELVRNEALKSLLLRGLSRPDLLALLQKTLRDPSLIVQKTAALALRALDPKQDPQALRQAYYRAQRFLMRQAIPTEQRPLAEFLDHAPAHQKIARWDEIEAHAPHNLSLLAYALTHADRNVQEKAIQTLRTHKAAIAPVFPHLIQLMGAPHTDSSLQHSLIALLQQDIPHALPHLQRALHSPNPRIARESCATLAEIPHHATPLVPNLIFALRRRRAWHEARRALLRQKTRAIPHLLRAIEHPHLIIRVRVLDILNAQPRTLLPLLPSLRRALKHSFTQLRWRATESLALLGPAALPALDDLILLLEDRSPFIRWRAARAIGEIGPAAAKAIPALLRQPNDPDPQLKKAARIALKKLGGPLDIEQLRRSLSHPNRQLVQRTLQLSPSTQPASLPHPTPSTRPIPPNNPTPSAPPPFFRSSPSSQPAPPRRTPS
ncbi:HEAT repeat domain-containing protein [Myxococcota bacterium]|nr:HEAT repeat domain-containing protein [Myxococcota bacterium]